MDDSKAGVWFFGDLSDPFVALIADSAPDGVEVLGFAAAGSLPRLPLEAAPKPPSAVVVHRDSLAAADLKTLERWRDQLGPRTPIIVCVSPFARYAEISRANRVVDAVVPEAAAPDSLAARLGRMLGLASDHENPAHDFRVEVSSGLYEMGRVMVDCLARTGLKAEFVDDLIELAASRGKRRRRHSSDRVFTIWDVPLLEPGWQKALAARVRATGPVIAVFAFADREAVQSAWDAGAAACLDAPGDFELLADIVGWTARTYPLDLWPAPARLERAHAVPPPRRGEIGRKTDPVASEAESQAPE